MLKNNFGWILFSLVLLTVLAWIPVRLTLALHESPIPQGIFVLGSNLARTEFAAAIWRYNPTLKIWVSDLPENLRSQDLVLAQAGVPRSQIYLDGRATDTVTNFTTLVEDFAENEVKHLILVTSDYHMSRARAIATIILGSRGIAITPAKVPTGMKNEPLTRVIRDCGRSILWVFTGKSGSSLNPRLKR